MAWGRQAAWFCRSALLWWQHTQSHRVTATGGFFSKYISDLNLISNLLNSLSLMNQPGMAKRQIQPHTNCFSSTAVRYRHCTLPQLHAVPGIHKSWHKLDKSAGRNLGLISHRSRQSGFSFQMKADQTPFRTCYLQAWERATSHKQERGLSHAIM